MSSRKMRTQASQGPAQTLAMFLRFIQLELKDRKAYGTPRQDFQRFRASNDKTEID
jgi:hypothetical protein